MRKQEKEKQRNERRTRNENDEGKTLISKRCQITKNSELAIVFMKELSTINLDWRKKDGDIILWMANTG